MMDSNAEQGKFYYGWVVVGLLLVIGIIALGSARFSYGVFFEALSLDFGWNRTSVSGVFSLYMLLCPAFTIVAGWAIGKFGPRRVFVASGLFTGLGLFLSSQVTEPWHLFFTYSLLLAMGTGYNYVISMTLVAQWFKEKRGLALGIVSCGVGIGMFAVPPLASFFISSYGWRMAYIIIAVMVIAMVIPAACLLKSPPLRKVTASDVGELGNETREFSLVQATRTRNFWLQMAILFVSATCCYIINTHIVNHALDSGIDSIQASLLLSCIGGSSVVGRLVVGKISDSVGGRHAFLLCTVILFVSMIGFASALSLWLLYVFAVLFGFSFGGISPVSTVLVGENFGVVHMGLVMAIINIGWDTGAAFGPLLAGRLFDISGNYFSAFLVGGGFALLASVLLLLLRRPGQDDQVRSA
jgi:MFS family permease